MKKAIGMLLILCISLQGKDFPQRKDLDQNPEMRKRMAEPEDKSASFKKPEFVTKYPELVTTKEVKKILASKNPIKLLSYDFIEKWKHASNLLVSTVGADATFEKMENSFGKDLTDYATEIRKQIAELSKQAAIIIEQYPIYSYKKPVLKKAKYNDDDKIAARGALRSAAGKLQKIAGETSKIILDIRGIPITYRDKKGDKKLHITMGQEQVYLLAASFAEKIWELASNLANEINSLS